jgi:hypothetical protein
VVKPGVLPHSLGTLVSVCCEQIREVIVFLKSAEEARSLAEKYLPERPMASLAEVVILDEHTIETDFGWVFFWNSKKYMETGEFQYALAGNAPLIVDRRDGSVHLTSTAYPVEEIIENYRKSHGTVR